MVNLSSQPGSDPTAKPELKAGDRIVYKPKKRVKGLPFPWAWGTVIGTRSLGTLKVDFQKHGGKHPNYWLVLAEDCSLA